MDNCIKKGRPTVGAQKKERINLTVDISTKKALDALRIEYQISASQLFEEYVAKEYRRLERKKKKQS